MARRTLTLSFDGHSIRMLIAREGTILNWDALVCPAEWMSQGIINEPKLLAKDLTSLLAQYAAPRRQTVTGITGHRTISRILSLPVIKTKLLNEAVHRRAKQEMPLPLNETYLSWHQIGEENNHLQIYAFAVPRQVIDRQMELLKAARIRPRAMELMPLALVRAVNQADAVIVNLEEQSLGVIIVQDGIPLIMRSVPQSGDRSDLTSRLDRLTQELHRTTQFFNENYRSRALQPDTTIFATGALLETEESRSALAERVGSPVALPDPPLELPGDFPVAAYCTNLGLALKPLG